jgi:hypothetical protein
MEMHIMKDTTPPQGTLLFIPDATGGFSVSLSSGNWTINPDFADIDGDGDLDMYAGQEFTLNSGTRNRPIFNSQSLTSSYGLPSGATTTSFADIDGDGDLDAFMGYVNGELQVHLNQGNRQSPVFGSAVTGAFGLPQASGNFIHDLADMDADGDLDALMGDGVGQPQIYLNTGTARSPVFGAAVAGAFGLPTRQGRLYLTDIDRDGDLDVLNGSRLMTNEGTASQPLFGAENALYLGDAAASLADLDGDGDLDAFIGYGKKGIYSIRAYTNIGTPVLITGFEASEDIYGWGNFGVGSKILMAVRFSESVVVTGVPQLRLNAGIAQYTSGSGTDTLHFTYTVQAGDKSSRLDYESAAALTLNGGAIQDAAGNHAILTLATPGTEGSLSFFGFDSGYVIVIDTVSPRVTSVSSTAADGLYKAGDSIDVQVRFGEAVTVTGSPQLLLETGAVLRAANYTTGSGTNTLTFRYTVQAGDTSADLDSIALDLNAGSIKATSGGANAFLALPHLGYSLAENKALVINGDTLAPHGTLGFVSPPLVNPYKLPNMGSEASPHFADIDHDGDFDAIVGNLHGEIRIYPNIGTPSKPEFGPAVAGSYGLPDRVPGRTQPTLGDIDGDGDLDVLVRSQIYLNTGTATKPNFGPAVVGGFGLSQYDTYLFVDDAHSLVDIDSDGDLDVVFGGWFYGTALSIVPNIGTPTNPAFSYPASNNFDFGFAKVVPALADINGDGLLDVIAGGADSPQRVDTPLYFPDSPRFYLNTGSARSPIFDKDNGSFGVTISVNDLNDLNDWFWKLRPAFVDIDHDGDLDLFFADGDGDMLFFRSLGKPVAPVTSPTAPGKYGAGSHITLSVGFSEPVFVTGTPHLTLETGKVDRAATYISGSGTSTLNFSYTVQAGDTSADLDYQSAAALALNGGSIHDAAGNEATFTLATPGALGSLGASSAIVIDGGLSLSLVGYTPELAAGSFFWF